MRMILIKYKENIRKVVTDLVQFLNGDDSEGLEYVLGHVMDEMDMVLDILDDVTEYMGGREFVSSTSGPLDDLENRSEERKDYVRKLMGYMIFLQRYLRTMRLHFL